MASLAFQNNMGQVQGLKVINPLGTLENSLRSHSLMMNNEKLNPPVCGMLGDPLTRHHPHGRRVRHINGLLDIPICAVFDYYPPTTTNRRMAAETLTGVEGVGATDGKVLMDPMEPVRQKGRSSSSSNPRRLRDALSDGSRIQAKIGELKKERGLMSHLADVQRIPTVSLWRENLRSLVASLCLPVSSPHADNDVQKEPARDPFHNRPLTTSTVQALGTVGRAPGRPLTSTSEMGKLPPLRGLYPRLLDGSNRPWFLKRNPGIASIRSPGLRHGAETGRGEIQIVRGHEGSTSGSRWYSETTGRLIPPPSRATTRGFTSGATRKRREEIRLGPLEKAEVEEMEGLVLGILCQLFQVDDPITVHAWLTVATDAEKTIVLDLVRSALTGGTSSDETRRNSVTSGVKEHSRTSGILDANGATDLGRWTDQKACDNGCGQTGRVDRLVFDHSQPNIRTSLVTCRGSKENGRQRSFKRTNKGEKVIGNDYVVPAAANQDSRMAFP